MPIVIVMFLLLSALPVLLRSQDNSWDLVTEPDDAPTRLLRWGVGLLPADRVEWGQAMVGELDSIEGRARRWRFSLGCAAGIVLMPPWGPIAPLVVLVAFALGGAAVFGVGFVHFGLDSNPWNWVVLAILAAILVGLIVAASVLLRRPGLAGPGLVGGTFVGAVWLGCSGLTFVGILDPIRSVGRLSIPILMIAVPAMVGVSGVWRSRSALVGRRTARLAGVTAGLATFFVSTFAVVAIDGGPRDPGVGVAGGVSEAFSIVAMTYLMLLPLATATIGWAAATATIRVRHAQLAQLNRDPLGTAKTEGKLAERTRSRANRPLRAAVVVVVVLAIAIIFVK